jgi:hypothetical protein
MRLGLPFILAFAACSQGTLKTPDGGAPADDLAMIVFPTATMIAPAATTSSCLGIDSTRLYWSDFTNNTRTIQSVALAGGTPVPIVPGGDKYGCVASDGAFVYYADNGSIMKAPVAGNASAGTPLASGQHLLTSKLVVAGGYVYWLSDVYGNVDMFSGMNAVVRLKTDGSMKTPEPFTATLDVNPLGLAVDASNVYYSDKKGAFIRPLADPGSVTPFGMAALPPSQLAVGAGHIALAEAAGGGAGDVAVFASDGSGRVVVSKTLGAPLAVDDKGVYLALDGQLKRLALDGSGATPLAAQAPRAVALSPTQVYFTDGATLWAVPR